MEEEIKNFSLGLSQNFGDHFAIQQYYNSLPAEVLKNIIIRQCEAKQSNTAVNDRANSL